MPRTGILYAYKTTGEGGLFVSYVNTFIKMKQEGSECPEKTRYGYIVVGFVFTYFIVELIVSSDSNVQQQEIQSVPTIIKWLVNIFQFWTLSIILSIVHSTNVPKSLKRTILISSVFVICFWYLCYRSIMSKTFYVSRLTFTSRLYIMCIHWFWIK